MRTITISCPSCRTEFKKIQLDEAEAILFHGCEPCRNANRAPMKFRGGRLARKPDDSAPAESFPR